MLRRINLVLVLLLFIVCAWQIKGAIETKQVLDSILGALRPVHISNCDLKKYGPPNDGGYFLCRNLIDSQQTAYSYGIENRDGWGCDISKEFGILVHQYDCFDLRRPLCDWGGGDFLFHEECIGSKAETVEGRVFDTLFSHIEKNQDKQKKIVIKMDVEGAEIDSLLTVPASTLQNINQLVLEMHGIYARNGIFYLENIDRLRKLIQVIDKLKQHFFVVNVHFTNMFCLKDQNWPMFINPSLPSPIFEALFVNKTVATPDYDKAPIVPSLEDSGPNFPMHSDCQFNWK